MTKFAKIEVKDFILVENHDKRFCHPDCGSFKTMEGHGFCRKFGCHQLHSKGKVDDRRWMRDIVDISVVVNDSIPPGEVHLRDGSGLVGKIVNIGDKQED